MDYEKLIRRLRNDADAYRNGKTLGRAFADQEDVLDNAATALSTLQTENTELRAELTHKTELVYRQANELERRDKLLKEQEAELEQVKHQLDSYRAYYDDLASKPNCNTCADKDCKYRPIPGDTVRANCPLWRGPEEG